MSAKDGGDHHHGGHHYHRSRKIYRRLFAILLALITLILFLILLIFLILRPTKPRFYLRDIAVSQFNVTDTNYLSSNLQVTISSTNPNSRIGIYYDKLDVYAEYKNQQVTMPTELPTGYQGHDDVAIWSPWLYGAEVPIAPYLVEALVREESVGLFLIDVKVDGKLRWKVGSWISGSYHIHVICPVFTSVGDGKAKGSEGFKFQQMITCSVDV